jgi:hypothetical protein
VVLWKNSVSTAFYAVSFKGGFQNGTKIALSAAEPSPRRLPKQLSKGSEDLSRARPENPSGMP